MVGRAIEELVDQLRTGFTDDPDGLRDRAVDIICRLGDATRGLWYEFGSIDGVPVPVRWMHRGSNPIDPVLEHWATSKPKWQHADPRSLPKSWLGRFRRTKVAIQDPDRTFYPTAFYREFVKPAQISDQLRMFVSRGGVLIGWIGAIRSFGEPDFERRHERRIAPFAEAVTDALVTAHAVQIAGAPEQGCDLLVTPNGKIELASQAGKAFADDADARAALARWVQNVDRGRSAASIVHGMHVRWSRLYATGRVRYLVHLELPPSVQMQPPLSPAQRRVAELACRGVTAFEIAQQLSIAESTVRAHLKAIYAQLGVSNRSELAAALGPAAAP